MTTYEVRFNKSKFAASSEAEAVKIAEGLIEPACPFEARIVEIDEDGEFVRTVFTLGPCNAR
jgi:hypothetical protein